MGVAPGLGVLWYGNPEILCIRVKLTTTLLVELLGTRRMLVGFKSFNSGYPVMKHNGN